MFGGLVLCLIYAARGQAIFVSEFTAALIDLGSVESKLASRQCRVRMFWAGIPLRMILPGMFAVGEP